MPFFSKYQQRQQQQQDSTPICRCRVLYLGSAVPHVTKDGLQGIQEPLRELYPEQGALGARGIDSWLSVWSNGLLLENVDENHKKVTRFFPIDSLHYCAAVRYVLVPEKSSSNTTTQPRFLPLDSPFARSPNPAHPPLFAAILRRTSGIKVLECHAFICKREAAANALVRCCFHAYADSSYARQMDGGSPPGAVGGGVSGGSLYGTLCNGGQSASPPHSSNSFEKVEGWRRQANHNNNHVGGSTLTLNSTLRRRSPSEDNHNSNSNSNSNNNDNDAEVSHLELSNSADDISIYNGDENHKIWVGSSRDVSAERDALYGDYSTMRSSRSSRPRQNVNAPAPPPPPPPMKEDNKTKKAGGGGTKDRGRRKKFSEGTREEMYYMVNGDAPRRPNGYYGGGGAALKSSSSVSGGTMLRNYPMKCYPSAGSIYSNGGLRPASMNGFHHHHHPPPHGGGGAPIPPPPAQPVLMVPTTLPHPPRRLSAGSYNTNKKHHQPPPGLLVPVPPQAGGAGPINFFPIPGNGPAAATMFIPTGKKSSKFQPMPIPMMTASEEPIYMPSARPMSPVASYQPGHFPHEAYLMQQYAAFASLNGGGDDDKKMKKKKKTKKKNEKSSNKKHSSSSSAIPPPPPLIDGHSLTSPHESAAHVDDDDDDDEADSSVYNSTGIYRRKGHLNERAFSYSIRQEHRSRSYGSLANLKFAPPPVIPNGNAIPPPPVALDVQNVPVNKQDLKKEREIMQMMHDLQLSGDELERSEVPPNVYQQNKIRAAKVRR